MMRQRRVARPQAADDLHPLLEDRLVVLEIGAERAVFAPVIAAPGGEIDPPARQHVERRPLLGDPDRMMQRQHRHRRREPNALGPRRHLRQHEIGAGEDAERREMMLADPRRMHPDRVGVDGLVEDVGDEQARGAHLAHVVVVAEGEVAEFLVACPGQALLRKP